MLFLYLYVICSVCIHQITRIENPQLYGLYALMRAHMNAANGDAVENEQILWHGTESDTVKIISHRGFNRSYCGRNGMMLSFFVNGIIS